MRRSDFYKGDTPTDVKARKTAKVAVWLIVVAAVLTVANVAVLVVGG